MNHDSTEYGDLNRCRNIVLSKIGISGCTAHFLSEATNDLDSVARLVAQAFVEREPMVNAIYKEFPQQTYEEMREVITRLVHDPATHDCSVMLKNSEGRVISAMLHTPYEHSAYEMPKIFAAINSVLDRLSESFDQWLRNRSDKPKIISGLITAVDSDYAGHALVKHQMDLALFRATQLGFTELAASATSVSQVILEHLGLHTIAEIKYDEYEQFKQMHASTSTTRPPINGAKMMWNRIDEIRTNIAQKS